MGCNCCEAPPCPGPLIETKSKAASGSKIGPPTPCGYSHDGKYWSVYAVTTTYAGTQANTPEHGHTTTWSYSSTETRTKSLVGGVCTESGVTYSGSSTYSVTGPRVTADCSVNQAEDGSWSGSFSQSFNGVEEGPYPTNMPCAAYGLPTVTPEYSTEVTPEEGETTAAMISRVTGELPAYPEYWSGGGAAASRNLSPDENSFSLSRFRWRLRHEPTGTCYLKVWLRKVTTLEDGDPEYSDISPYTWIGSGNPCFNDAGRAPSAEENLITGPETEVGDPSEDGSVTIEIVKWSCLPGYTPPDDGSANGFPPAEVPE